MISSKLMNYLARTLEQRMAHLGCCSHTGSLSIDYINRAGGYWLFHGALFRLR